MSVYFPQETIRKKRDGGILDKADIAQFVAGIADGTAADAQIGAFAMAVLLRGMESGERVALTEAMARSGYTLDWSDLPGPTLDKHSTGGIGDKVSLILAPLVAACGGFVPMISGRGLGHTGGTLDKLEAIPGYAAQPPLDLFRKAVRDAGAAIIGQTADLAPADRRFYAIRDVTATVESIPLITASILSKKLAAGLRALVMDVKFGSGAFMVEYGRARELAVAIVETAKGAGLPTIALLTDMDRPLGHAAGNAVEVREAVDALTGARCDPRLMAVTMALAAELLVLGGLASDLGGARQRLNAALNGGMAAERFQRMVTALGGPRDFVANMNAHLPKADIVMPALPGHPGVVGAIDTRAIGLAVMALGGGRRRPDDKVDHAVGFTELAGLGDQIGSDRPLALIHARSQNDAATAAEALRRAYRLADRVPEAAPTIRERIG
ncbi:MAG: thymidine phosphorylase [Alphaproteobacteria bacterium]|nr:thymidine phosphorylase [Alphaproteobacteria bacterium]